MKVFVVFGSASDEPVSKPLVEAISKHCETEYEVISAHRDLEKLREKMNTWKGDAIVAGAGLAAALPGVVAAMTKLPVFGVPVPSQFGGLDSAASIAQMPPGVPVLCCGPRNTAAIPAFLKQYKEWKRTDRIHIVANAPAADMEKAKAIAPFTVSAARDESAFNIHLVSQPGQITEAFGLHVPLLQNTQDPAGYLPVLDWMNRGGLWVGVNNTRNAVHAALRLRGTT